MVMGRVEESIRLIAFLPGMGRARAEFGRSTRSFPVSPRVIVYRPLAELDGIRILRVVDGRRDLPAVLGKQ
jgi:plasmid stabilization system protein ParE